MQESGEKVYLASDDIRITSQQVTVQQKVIPLSAIGRASVQKNWVKVLLGLGLGLLLGLLLLSLGAVLPLVPLFIPNDGSQEAAYGRYLMFWYLMLPIGALVALVGLILSVVVIIVIVIVVLRSKHVLQIVTTDGHRSLHYRGEKKRLREIATAIEQALSDRNLRA